MNKLFIITVFISQLLLQDNSGWADELENTTTYFEEMKYAISLSGEELNVSELTKNKVTVVRFWSHTCPHSNSLNTRMQSMYDQYHPKRLFS